MPRSEAVMNKNLLTELMKDTLWHCTSKSAFGQILADGVIQVNDGRVKKWGNRPHACQFLGAVCLFDFHTPTHQQVRDTIDRWQDFIFCSPPVTVVIGLTRYRLPGRLIRYPATRDLTSLEATGCGIVGPIPHVEVCHPGSIPTNMISHVILVSHHQRFRVCEPFNPDTVFQTVEELIEQARREE